MFARIETTFPDKQMGFAVDSKGERFFFSMRYSSEMATVVPGDFIAFYATPGLPPMNPNTKRLNTCREARCPNVIARRVSTWKNSAKHGGEKVTEVQ